MFYSKCSCHSEKASTVKLVLKVTSKKQSSVHYGQSKHSPCISLSDFTGKNVHLSGRPWPMLTRKVYKISTFLMSLSGFLCDFKKLNMPGFSFSATASTIRKSPSAFSWRSVRIFFNVWGFKANVPSWLRKSKNRHVELKMYWKIKHYNR